MMRTSLTIATVAAERLMNGRLRCGSGPAVHDGASMNKEECLATHAHSWCSPERRPGRHETFTWLSSSCNARPGYSDYGKSQ